MPITTGQTLRGLILHRPGQAPGGDVVMVEDYAAALNEWGVETITRSADRLDGLASFDFVQLWAACSPDWGLPAARAVKAENKPLLVTPMWWGREKRQAFYGHAGEDLFPGYTQMVAETLKLADVLTVSTMAEAVECWKIAPNVPAIKAGLSCRMPPAELASEVHDIVLCLGRIEGHKNQHSLAKACQRMGVQLVCAGKAIHPDIVEAARVAGAAVLEPLDWGTAMMYLSHARVHALPSFSEAGGTANMEACLLGVPAVMGNTTEPEFFGDGGIYCEPASIESIESALVEAWTRPHGPWAAFPTWRDVAQRVKTWLISHNI